MRIGLHESSVHIGARVALVAIGYDIFPVALFATHHVPLDTGGEAGASATAKTAVGDSLADLFGSHLT